MTDVPPVTGPRFQQYMPLSALQGNVRNPKAHDLQSLRASLGRFGYIEPITLDERTQLLISGHGRVDTLKAERAAGFEPPEGVVIADGDWWVPVSRGWASRDDEDAHAALIAINRHVELGGWQPEPLATLLAELNDGRGLDGVGYTGEQLQDILVTLGPAPSLDEMEQRYGPSHPEDFWPTLSFKVNPEVKTRFEKLLAGAGAGDDSGAQFAWLVTEAERAQESVLDVA